MAGVHSKPCNCGSKSSAPVRQKLPQWRQFFCFARPEADDFCTSSWGEFVATARSEGVNHGRIVQRAYKDDELVQEIVKSNISI